MSLSLIMFVSLASDLFGSLYPIVCITALLDHDSFASGFIGPRCLILLILMLAWLKVASPLALLDLGVRFYINAHLAHGSLASGFIGSMCLIVRILMHVWLMVALPLALLELGVQLRIY